MSRRETEAATQIPAAGTWVIDPVHSNLGFVARYLMVTKVRGHFNDFSGTIHIADGPELSSVEVTITAASIDTENEMRDNHLRSPDFLDVERFPTLQFKSTKVEQTGDNELRVIGDLTIRDVTRPVVLEATFEGATSDLMGNSRVAFSATTEIDREDFGITWNQTLETGGVLVGRKIRIELETLATLQAP